MECTERWAEDEAGAAESARSVSGRTEDTIREAEQARMVRAQAAPSVCTMRRSLRSTLCLSHPALNWIEFPGGLGAPAQGRLGRGPRFRLHLNRIALHLHSVSQRSQLAEATSSHSKTFPVTRGYRSISVFPAEPSKNRLHSSTQLCATLLSLSPCTRRDRVPLHGPLAPIPCLWAASMPVRTGCLKPGSGQR